MRLRLTHVDKNNRQRLVLGTPGEITHIPSWFILLRFPLFSPPFPARLTTLTSGSSFPGGKSSLADSIAAVYGSTQLEKLIPVDKILISTGPTSNPSTKVTEEKDQFDSPDSGDDGESSSVAMSGYISKFSDDDNTCRSTGGTLSSF